MTQAKEIGHKNRTIGPRRRWVNNIVALDPLLGGNREIGNCTSAVSMQRPANKNRGMVFSALSAKQQLNSNNLTVFL
jgi:hypothetical protein